MPQDADPPLASKVFQALAYPARRRLLEALVGGVQDIGELARRCGLERRTAAHHLGVLQRAGLVQVRHRQGLVRPEGLELLRRYFDSALTAAAISSPAR